MSKLQPELSMSREKFISDLSMLISFPTITGQPEGFAEAMAFVREQISSQAHVELIENNGEPILLASNKPGKNPDICYLVHIDVVNAKPEQFSMMVEGNTAIGRGVSDMKYSIPLGYSLLNDLINLDSGLSFMLAITSDEERGGFNGAGFLADEYGLRPGIVIVPDGGDNFVLINKSKGVCHIRVSKVGVPAHSSRPWLGENALAPIVELASELFDEYQEANSKDGWQTTMNIGRLQGGISINQVAPSAELDLDFRFPPETDSVERLTEKVKKLASGIDTNLKVEILATGTASFSDLKHPAMRLFMQTLQSALGREMVVEGGLGSHDGRHFNKLGIPFIMTKPDGGDIHGDQEYLDIDSTMFFYRELLRFLQSYELLIAGDNND